MCRKKMIIFYGGHHVSCLKELLPLIKKQMRFAKRLFYNFIFILENGGPYPQHIKKFKKIFPRKTEGEIYDIFIDLSNEAYDGYITKRRKKYSRIINGEKISIGLPEFDYELIDFALKNEVPIIREKPNYNDFKNYQDYIPPIPAHVFSQIMQEFNRKYGRDPIIKLKYWDNYYQNRVFERLIEYFKPRENTFIKLIQRVVREKPKNSFVIVRGSIHKNYYNEIKQIFQEEFIIKKIEYGTQAEEKFNISI